MNKAKELDQWFTKQNVANHCVKIMKDMGFIKENTDVIEPSVGKGAFVTALLINQVDENYIHCFDIDTENINKDLCSPEQRDWLNSDDLELSSRAVIIGNPPYGKKGKLAIEFINKSLNIADVVGFIVPITLSTSWTAQKNVRQDAELIYEETLPKNSFTFEGKDVDVPSVFQIWRKKYRNLRLSKPETEHCDLEIHIYNKMPTAIKWLNWDWDIAVKRNSKNGEFILKGETASEDNHWILVKGPIDKLKKIDWSKLNDNKMTAGMGKADVVKAYKEILNDN